MVSEFLREVLRFVVFVLIRPLLVVLAAVFSPIYKLLFGWLDDRLLRKDQEGFEKEIKQNLAWLFERHGAQVIPNLSGRKHRRILDYVDITVSLEPVLFQFVRGRGEFRVDVAPQHIPNDWQEIGEAIAAIHELRGPPQYYRLEDFGRLLERNLNDLRKAFSKAAYGDARRGRKPTLTRL